MTVDIAQWRLFLTAAERGSLIQAAEVLHTDQPALSRSLKRLERLIGAPLFVRTSKGLTLTELGRRMLEPARELVAQADAIEARARAEVRRGSGVLTVGALDIYPMTAAIADACDGLVVGDQPIVTELLSLPWSTAPHAVAARTIDVGFNLLIDGRLPDPTVMRSRTFWEETEVFALISERHPLAGAEVIDPRDLSEVPLHLPNKIHAPDLYNFVLERLADAGVPAPRRAQPIDTFANIIAQIAAGDGWSMSARTLARRTPPGIVARPLATPLRRSVTFAAVWHVDGDQPVIDAFVERVGDAFARYVD